MDCLFCEIAKGKIQSDIVYEDEQVLVLSDINPQAPEHKLIIPRKHIATINDLAPEDGQIVGHMTLVAKQMAKSLGVEEAGYRLVFNVNEGGGQAVYHIHMHLLAGRQLTWPPG